MQIGEWNVQDFLPSSICEDGQEFPSIPLPCVFINKITDPQLMGDCNQGYCLVDSTRKEPPHIILLMCDDNMISDEATLDLGNWGF